MFANSADSISGSQLLSEAFEISNIYRTSTFAYEAVSSTDQLTNNCPNMGQLHDIKTFTFSCPLPKKVDWSLSPPSPPDSSCRVSSLLICRQQSSREEFPTSQHSLTTGAWTMDMVYFYSPKPLSQQHLDWQGHLHVNGASVFVSVCP